MADGLNRATLLGNLGADPELKFTQGGQAVLKLRLATASSWIDKSGERKERTDWHTIVFWGKRAEGLNKVLSKGTRVYVEGSIQTRSWEDDKGVKRYATEIVGSNAVLCGGGGSRAGSQRSDERSGSGEYDQDYGGGGGGVDDDIPF